LTWISLHTPADQPATFLDRVRNGLRGASPAARDLLLAMAAVADCDE
jgi:hypothetical protein